jgi:hypothetical protein
MNRFLHFLLLVLSPLIMKASGDTLKTEPLPIKRWHITTSAGYGFPFSKAVLGGIATVDSNSTITGKLVRGTFGKGTFSFVSVSYSINQHFGSEFGIHSTWGKRIMTSQLTGISTGTVFYQRFLQVSTNGMFIGFFMTDTYSKFHISFHNDLLVGVMNFATEQNFNNGVQKPIWKYSGGISYGWLSRIGGSYDISDKMNIGLSGFFLMHSWSPKQRENLNGTDKITFTDNTLANGIYQISSDQLPRITYPLHVAGVNLFVTYSF